MPCFGFQVAKTLLKKFEERFFANKSDKDLAKVLEDLINSTYDNFWTNKYDFHQKLTNGISP